MGILKTVNQIGKYYNNDAYYKITHYILNPAKAIHHHIGFIGLDPLDPAGSMRSVAEQFGKTKGVRVRHFIVAFDPREPITPETADQIGRRIIHYLGREFQALYAVHEDEPQLHIHIVINAVSHVDGHKYRGTHEVFRRFMDYVRRTVKGYGVDRLEYVSSKSDFNI